MKENELQEFIVGLLDRLSVTGHKVSVLNRTRETVFNIELGDDAALFFSGENEALRALNTLVRKVAEKHAGEETLERVRVDINSHDTAHIEFLENQARTLAERARSLKQDIEMSPANAYDRMIVHETLRDEENITTESEGEGSLRHLVIRYIGG